MPPPHPNTRNCCVIIVRRKQNNFNNLLFFGYSSYFAKTSSSKKVVARLTEHDDVITRLLKGAPRLSLALGPAHARAGSGCACLVHKIWGYYYSRICPDRHLSIRQFVTFSSVPAELLFFVHISVRQFTQFIIFFYPWEAICSANTSFVVSVLMFKQLQ